MENAKQIVNAIRFQVWGGVEKVKSIECGLGREEETKDFSYQMSMNK